MGTNNSTRQPRMSVSETDSRPSTSHQEEPQDVQAILAYLIRSGQVRILTNDEDDVDSKEEDSDGCEFTVQPGLHKRTHTRILKN